MNPWLERFPPSVDLGGVRVINFSGYIFFCGGRTNPDPNGRCFSARDFLQRKMATNYPSMSLRIRFAEEITDWFREAHFDDLLTFERHLSCLASVIFLVAESPGSFAELGSFSVDDEIIQRLILLISEENDSESSYISLGPVAYLRSVDEGRVFVYPWRSGFSDGNPFVIEEDLEKVWREIVNDLLKFDRQDVKERAFVPKNPGHMSLFICDLISLFGALTLEEVTDVASRIVSDIDKKVAKRHLFVIEKLGLGSGPINSGFMIFAEDGASVREETSYERPFLADA